MGHLNLLTEFLFAKHESREIFHIPPPELDDLLAQYFLSVRQINGKKYEPSSLRGMLGSFERELKKHEYSESLITSVQFSKTRNALKSKQKDLKKQGLGNRPKTADRISDADVDCLFEAGELGISTPNSILNSLWYFNTLLFGMRGGAAEHRALCWGDVRLGFDKELDKHYLEYNERQTKTRTGADISMYRNKPRMYEMPETPGRCPVNIYKTYRDKRPQGYSNPDDPYYIAATTVVNPGPNQAWFMRGPVGQNKLKTTMKRMVSRANMQSDKRLTNTSVRKHLCQKLMENQVPDTQAVQITGHKNPNSLNNYRSLNSAQKNHISSLLANTNTVQQPGFHTQSVMSTAPIFGHSVAQSNTQNSSHQAHKSVFCGSAIHGGVFNITINNNSVLSRKRSRVIDSDSE